jgi:hypothetical protein
VAAEWNRFVWLAAGNFRRALDRHCTQGSFQDWKKTIICFILGKPHLGVTESATVSAPGSVSVVCKGLT